MPNVNKTSHSPMAEHLGPVGQFGQLRFDIDLLFGFWNLTVNHVNWIQQRSVYKRSPVIIEAS
ncbi:MAG: hypothetical protein B1H13_13635 [Desulfobacteraceae bacterium 4484_190.3]|nr:MAG: hypothetical protein B1H13_13635 [Desulfobacteraceae bacterium 4484_190.3]